MIKDKMKILIFKDKYCARYFKAETKEQRNHAALEVMKERLENGWYHRPSEPTYEPEVSEEIYAGLSPLLKSEEDRTRKRGLLRRIALFQVA